jgi:DNA-binding NarL/FixJ family response regulator
MMLAAFPKGAQAARPTNGQLRVLVADQSVELRTGLRAELEQLQFVKVIGEAHASSQALDFFFRFRPDVVVVSVCLSNEGGFEVLRQIRQTAPTCAVILTTRWSNPFVEETASLLGAKGVCPTADGFSCVRRALERLANQQPAPRKP